MEYADQTKRRAHWLGLFSLLCLVFAMPQLSSAQERELSSLVIVTKAGPQVFSVELADNPQKKVRGLMFREYLGQDRGMLFLYPANTQINMWMKNTLIPLDMIFIDSESRIRNIAENTEPLSEDTISSDGGVRAVLEVPGGTAARLGIAPGDRVSHVALD